MQHYKQLLKHNQDELCEKIVRAVENNPDLSFHELLSESNSPLSSDIESSSWIRAKLRALEAHDGIVPERDYPYAISSQKMPEILEGAQQILSEQSSFQAILNGKYPQKFNNDDVSRVTLLGVDIHPSLKEGDS